MAIILEQIVACFPLLTCCHHPRPPCLPAPAAGTRQLGAAVGGLTLMMPPAQTLLTQTLLLLLTRNEPAYCSAPVGGWERIEPSGGCSGPVCTCPLHVSASWPL